MSIYFPYDQTKPDVGPQTRKAAIDSARYNEAGVRDFVMFGFAFNWTYSVTIGTGTAEQPQFTFFRNTVNTSLWFRVTPTWGIAGGNLGNPTAILLEYSDDNQVTWATVGTIALTWDANGNLSSTTGGAGWGAMMLYLLGKSKATLVTYNAHAATTTGAHNTGTLALQNANAIAATGGTADNVSIGETTQAVASFSRTREKSINLGATLNGTVNIAWNTGTEFYGTVTGNTTFTFTGLPAAGLHATVEVRLQNAGGFTITLPAAVMTPGNAGLVFTGSGYDRFVLICAGDGRLEASMALKDTRNV